MAAAICLVGGNQNGGQFPQSSPDSASPPAVRPKPDEFDGNSTGERAADSASSAGGNEHGAQQKQGIRPATLGKNQESLELTEFLVVPAVGHYGKSPLHRDAVELLLVSGQWQPPTAGGQVAVAGNSKRTWRFSKAIATNGASDRAVLDTRRLRGGYAYATIRSPENRIMLLEAQGHSAVYVNGRPRAGDPYGLGWLRQPIVLRSGDNELLFHIGGERLSARLVAPQSQVQLEAADLTVPNWIHGETTPCWAAVPVVNATDQALDNAVLVCQLSKGQPIWTPVPTIQPVSVHKAAFRIPPPDASAGDESTDQELTCRLRLVRRPADRAPSTAAAPAPEDVLAELSFPVHQVGPTDIHQRTFRSTVDSSIQPFAVRPASPASGTGKTENRKSLPGVILALHDAAVPCGEFAAHYSPKPWAHIVSPMGRRPYGFDWESWGRIDALEALAEAQRHYDYDPRRICLTGHAMGGHGAWHLGVTYPSRFAAIAPIAGWTSFWSYGGGMPLFENPSPIQEMLTRGYTPSDTLELLGNLRRTGICILHGVDDQVVPVAQARFMRSRLADFHSNFAYYEQSDTGHWWGPETCDAPRLMQFLRHQQAPAEDEVDMIDFTTANPGVAHGSYWASIEAQNQQLRPSRLVVRHDQANRKFQAKTINVARLAIDVAHCEPSKPLGVEIDGDRFESIAWPTGDTRLWFEHREDFWTQVNPPSSQLKGPHRYGTFKAVFDNRALLVYGTQGTKVENDWARAKARFDAETFWYRGNGALEVVADTQFDAGADRNRNVILYGNAETNAAWPALLSTCPVQVRRGEVRVGIRPEAGDDLAVLFVRPRPGSDRALVGVVAGTGPAGMRLTNRLRYFISGVAYPDLLIFGPGTLAEGTGDIRALGYFGLDWDVNSGEIVWRDVAL